MIRVEAGQPFENARQLSVMVIGVFDGRPVFLKDVARIDDGPEEVVNYVRHGWGPARGFTKHEFFPGTVLGETEMRGATGSLSARAATALADKPPVAPAGSGRTGPSP